MIKRILTASAVSLLAILGPSATPAHATGANRPTVTAEKPTFKAPKATARDVRITKPTWPAGNHRVPPRPGQPTILTGTSRDYAVASLALTNTGSDLNINQVNPFVTNTDLTGSHSLAEVSVSSNSQAQIIEAGWRKTAADTVPKFFVASWVNGVFQGYGTNFTLHAGRVISPGDNLTTGVAKKYSIQYDSGTVCGATTGAWWILHDVTFVGYYCANLFTAASGIRTGTADFDQWFFEIAYDTTRGYWCGDMGSGSQGSLGSGGLPDVGYLASMRMFGQVTTLPTFNPFMRTVPASPTFGTHSINAASNRTMYGGGPGRNSAGTALGSKGSC